MKTGGEFMVEMVTTIFQVVQGMINYLVKKIMTHSMEVVAMTSFMVGMVMMLLMEMQGMIISTAMQEAIQ